MGKDNKNCTKRCFFVVLCSVMLLCGCGADGSDDEIVMRFSAQEEPDTGQFGENMTCVSENSDDTALNVTNMSENSQKLFVHVCGAVANPGVYQMEPGSRLYEAVEMAGGLTDEADETCLNMARQLSDGEQVLILTKEETAAIPRTTADSQGTQTPGLVNINTATMAELTTVSGIGESRAQAIIAYREANGSFRCIEDIKKVDGIKDGLFSKIKDQITV